MAVLHITKITLGDKRRISLILESKLHQNPFINFVLKKTKNLWCVHQFPTRKNISEHHVEREEWEREKERAIQPDSQTTRHVGNQTETPSTHGYSRRHSPTMTCRGTETATIWLRVKLTTRSHLRLYFIESTKNSETKRLYSSSVLL